MRVGRGSVPVRCLHLVVGRLSSGWRCRRSCACPASGRAWQCYGAALYCSADLRNESYRPFSCRSRHSVGRPAVAVRSLDLLSVCTSLASASPCVVCSADSSGFVLIRDFSSNVFAAAHARGFVSDSDSFPFVSFQQTAVNADRLRSAPVLIARQLRSIDIDPDPSFTAPFRFRENKWDRLKPGQQTGRV